MKRTFTVEEAEDLAWKIGLDPMAVDIEEFREGLSVELEHGTRDPLTNVTNDDLAITGRIAWAHLNELPDYYTRLRKMESEAEAERSSPLPG